MDDVCHAHGFAVRRAYAGSGRALLRWVAGHPRLRAYVERAGYTPRGDVRLADRTAARFDSSGDAARRR